VTITLRDGVKLCMQWVDAPTPFEHLHTLPGQLTRIGIDVCDNGTPDSVDDPPQDHTRRSPGVNAGGRRQSPVTVCRPTSRTNDDCDLSLTPTARSDKQPGPRT